MWIDLIRSVRHARRHGLLRLRPVRGPVRLVCKGGECGLCCATMGNSVVVLPDEIQILGPDRVQRHGASTVLKSREHACAFLSDRSCSIYDTRPRGCREYPWYRIEGKLYVDTGCPGIMADHEGRPDASTLQDIDTYFAGVPRIVKRIVMFWITR